MTIQDLIGQASTWLQKAYEIFQASQKALKDLKKELKNTLKQSPDWQELEEQLKVLKNTRKEMTEQIKDLQKAQDQISVELDEYQVVQDFVLTMDDKYNEVRDKELNSLSRQLSEKWIIAEIEYKKWKLVLVVAKHTA